MESKMEVAKQSTPKTEVLKKLFENVNGLSLEHKLKDEFKECIQNVLTVDFGQLSTVNKSCKYSKFDVSMKSLMKFSKVAINCIGTATKASGQQILSTVCNVATTVITYCFAEEDISSTLIRHYSAIMNEELRLKCFASCTKLKHCISYMQGLPNPDNLQSDDKKMHLLLLATDVPVQTGLDELLYLGERIRKLVRSAIQDMNNLEDLMKNIELYSCLATLRELFLLYRFGFQSMLEVNAESVRNIIEAQQADCHSVFEFLYKPTVANVKLFYAVQQGHWPLSKAFCERRGLLVDDLMGLDKGVYKIKSVEDNRGLYVIGSPQLPNYKFVDCIFMESSLKRERNVFSFQTESHFIGVSENAQNLRLRERKEFWKILKVLGNSKSDKECYMIWLESDIKKCLCQERNDSSFLALTLAFVQNKTCLSTSKDIGSSFLWTIEPL